MTEQWTKRLRLLPVAAADAESLAAISAIYRDARTWEHLPAARFPDDQWLTDWVAEQTHSWSETGLGWWCIQLSVEIAGVAPGTVIGAGGCATVRGWNMAWSLGYRLAPAVWGQHLATELSLAAVDTAHEVSPTSPVTARVLERNPASWRVLEKAGLNLVWSGASSSNYHLTSGLARRVYTDRPIADDLLDHLIVLG